MMRRCVLYFSDLIAVILKEGNEFRYALSGYVLQEDESRQRHNFGYSHRQRVANFRGEGQAFKSADADEGVHNTRIS